MSDTSIGSRVIDIVSSKLDIERDKVTPGAFFVDDLGADSLDTVELVMEFEEQFELEIPDEDAEKIRTVGDAIDYIEKKAGAHA